MKFQILSWVSEDDETYNIHLFGKTEDQLSVCLTVEYQPFLYIENTPGMSTVIEEHKSYTKAIKYTKVKKEKFYGYSNYKQYNFYKLYYSTQREWRNAQYYFEKKKITLYEANVDPILKFLHDSDIETAGWVEVINYTKYPHTDMKVDIHIETNNYKNVKKLEKDEVAPFVIASFDIECYSPDNSFPDPENIDCPVIQIATTFYKVGDENYFKKVLLTLDTCDPIEDVEVYSYENEKDLLDKWTEIIHENKTDCYLGYNIWGFDFWYMYKRATMVGAEDFLQLGKTEKEAELKFTNFSSSAYGYSDYKMVSSPGIFQLDLLVVMKRDYKLTSYSLNNVSAHFLGDQKEDLSPKEMFAKHRGSSKDRRDIGTYCVKDTYLPLKLIQKLAIFTNMIEMAKITLVPISFLIERGQGIKVFSQLCYETKQQNMLIETFTYKKRSKNPEDSDYEGATVLNAKKGSYMEEPITGLDFASLYPSIMRAHNLCVSTLVFHPSMKNIEGETYDIIDGFPFAQNRKGVIPRMLEKLALARKDAKKAMNNAKSDFMKMVYNGKQLAYKVSMNSIYGACGSPTFQVPCKIVAACTTSKGREMIEQTKNMVEKNYPGSEVVYGDSVVGDTPLLIQDKEENIIKRIDELEGNWMPYQNDKVYFIPKDPIYVWNDSGFTKIQKVIKHKTTKRLYRILTHNGVVDVTEDHSLLKDNHEIVKPKDLTINTQLLHHNIDTKLFNNKTNISLEEAKLMGFFMGDGSCGKYGIKYSWALNNKNLQYLEMMKNLAPFETKILDTVKSSNVYKLVPIGNIKNITEKYRFMFYNNKKEKIVPNEIIESSIDIIEEFWKGYYLADGSKTSNSIRCDAKGKQGVFGLYIILKRLGYNISINTRNDKKQIFRLNITKLNQRKTSNQIKKIIDLGITNDYVYDLETENHHFHVGPGSLIVHNTDSVMVKFPTKSIEESFKLGEEAADIITKTFKHPIELEMEKVYNPYLLWAKKRYAGLMYTKPEKPDYIDAKGIQLVRRDNCPLVRKISKEILNLIMYEKDIEKAKKITQEYIRKLEHNEIPIEDLVVSKSLKRIKYTYDKNSELKVEHDYANPQPHVQVAENIERREKGTGPKSGERVPYVFINTGNPKDLQYMKAEHPDFVQKNSIELDIEYYKERSLLSPVESLFELFYDNPKKEIFDAYEKGKQLDVFEIN